VYEIHFNAKFNGVKCCRYVHNDSLGVKFSLNEAASLSILSRSVTAECLLDCEGKRAELTRREGERLEGAIRCN